MKNVAILLCLAVLTAAILAAPPKTRKPRVQTTAATTTTTEAPCPNEGCRYTDGTCHDRGTSWTIYDYPWQGSCDCESDGSMACVL